MRREGPSFASWLLGRIAHPPRTARCSQCGSARADVPPTGGPAVCAPCRKTQLAERIARSLGT